MDIKVIQEAHAQGLAVSVPAAREAGADVKRLNAAWKEGHGAALRYLRRHLSLTLETVAEALDVSIVSVSQWETGKAYPEIERYRTLSAVYGVPYVQLRLVGLPSVGDIENPPADVRDPLAWADLWAARGTP